MAFWIYSGSDNREAVTRDIYVPCGERMTVMLADGTKVYLNADTKLTYPEQFVGKERKVSVEGEAFHCRCRFHADQSTGNFVQRKCIPDRE